jgi:hypothetical protein
MCFETILRKDMPRTCTICTHPERAEIESQIVAGVPYRNIAKQYGNSPAALVRHVSEHISQEIQASQVAKEEAQALDVVKQLREVNAVTLAIMKEARADKKNGMALFAIDRVQKQLELQAKLLGDINDRPQINIWLTPEWRSIRSAIIQSLLPYPDAKIAVASALATLEHERASLN